MLEDTSYIVRYTKIQDYIVDIHADLNYFLDEICLNYILLFIGYVNVCS